MKGVGVLRIQLNQCTPEEWEALVKRIEENLGDEAKGLLINREYHVNG